VGGVIGCAQVNWCSFICEVDDLLVGSPTYLSFSFSSRGNLWIRYKDELFLIQFNGYEVKTILGLMGVGVSSFLVFWVYESVIG
jgi:hypothetical protein